MAIKTPRKKNAVPRGRKDLMSMWANRKLRVDRGACPADG
jgi:hypothetical protein